MKRILLSLMLSLGLGGLCLTIPSQAESPSDTLTNPSLEPPAGDRLSQGLWWLYHVQYDKARATIEDYVHAHPSDPLGYFYETAVDWWELAQDMDAHHVALEKKFEHHFDLTVDHSTASYRSALDNRTRAVALLCEGGAFGLRGRWLVGQKEWTRAYSLGKNGYRLLKKSIALDPTLYEPLLGLGIYDYYTATLPGVMGFVAKIAMGGNKSRGLSELYLTYEKAKYARVEAAIFLIQINNSFEKNPAAALVLARQLRKEFPESPVMHFAEIDSLYASGQWKEGIRAAENFIYRCENGIGFYSQDYLKIGIYYAGVGILYGDRDAPSCLTYMNRVISGEKGRSQWYNMAYLRRGQAYDILGKRELAKADYRTVLSRKDVWNSHKKASEFLRSPYVFEKKQP